MTIPAFPFTNDLGIGLMETLETSIVRDSNFEI